MSVDIIARALGGRALALIQNSGGRYVGNTNLTAGQEQQQLTDYVKNETGGNPQLNDRVGDITTGIIWTFNGTKWVEGVVDPNAQQIQKNKNDIANLTKRVTKNEDDIVDLQDGLAQEKIDRQAKDDDLQDQIDALQALAKGVKEVVGTYADMEALDKTLLTDGDIINVLSDETHDGINAYYRFDQAAQAYTYIGSISPYYTKIEIDNKENKLKEEIAKKQNKLIAGDGIELTDNGDETVTIKAKLEGLQSDTPLENGDKYFTDGGAYKLAPTLNGQKVLENPTFYAPETIGTEGQIITVNAAGQLAWVDNTGGGTIDGLEINGVTQPVTPDTKIIQINTDDSLTENADTNTFYVSKANVPIVKDDYNNLTQAQKEDETKVYLITDDVTDVPVVISNINDEDITSQSEDFTRSNKYLTEKFNNLKITLNGSEAVVNTDLKIYTPIEAGDDGKAVLWSSADNKPVWGDASKVTLNGATTTNASFYAPVVSGASGRVLKSMGENVAPEWSDTYVPKLTLNGTIHTGSAANPTFYAPNLNRPSDAKKYMISNGTAGDYAGIEIPSIHTYNGSCTATSGGTNVKVSGMTLFSGTPSYTHYFTVDGESFKCTYSGTYLVNMRSLTKRAARDGYLYYQIGTSGATTMASHYFKTDNPGQNFPFNGDCIIHCTAGVWYYPFFKNTNSGGNDTVSDISLTVQLLQLD